MEAIAFALIAVIVLVLLVAAVLVARLVDALVGQNRSLLCAVVAKTPKDFGILTKPDPDHGRTPAQQAQHDQEQAARRQIEAEMGEHLEGLGYDPRQIGI